MAGEPVELLVNFPATLKEPVRRTLHALCRRYAGAIADAAAGDSQFDAAAPLTDRIMFVDPHRPPTEAEIVEVLDALEEEFDVDIQRPENGPIRMTVLRRRS